MAIRSSDGRGAVARPDLRFQTLTLDPPDAFVQRLATAARASRPSVDRTPLSRRAALALAAFVGFGAVSVGGAWAAGVIEVPGMPDSPLRPAPQAPRDPAPGQPGGGAPPAGERGDDGSAVRRDPAPTPKVEAPRATPSAGPDDPAGGRRGNAPDQPSAGRPDAPGEQGRGRGDERGRGHDKSHGKGQGRGKPTEKPRDGGRDDADRGQDREKGERGRPVKDADDVAAVDE